MSKLRFAIVGCGRIAAKHIDALQQLDHVELVAVCDIIKDRARNYAEKLGIPYYLDYHDMLQKEEIDVLNILTPSGLHARHTIDIVENYQKHIVCEKPMSLKLEDADQMIDICNKYDVRLFIVMQNRFNLAVQVLKKALDQGRFGKLVLGTVRVRWSRDQDYYDADGWRGTWELDGGCLTNQASHHIDLLSWMLGNPLEVTAKVSTRLLDIEVEDTGAAIITFVNGAIGIVEATTATRPSNLEGSLSILGEKGTVEIGGFAVNEIKTWLFTNPQEEDKKMIQTIKEHPPDVYGFGHKRYLEHVVDCLTQNKPALVDGIEGRKSLEILHAIYESSETGNTITLRYVPKNSKLGKKK